MAALGRLLAMMSMIVLAISFNTAFAADPDMLQDLCVADLNSAITVNGFPCRQNATADDFFTDILATPRPPLPPFGVSVNFVTARVIPGLNTNGISLNRVEFAPGGVNTIHSHPRASEIAFVLEGVLFVGFITTDRKLFSKNIKKGEVFVFPRGLLHFQRNISNRPASFLVAFNSQNPGVQRAADSSFGSNPPIPDEVLETSYLIDAEQAREMKARFATAL